MDRPALIAACIVGLFAGAVVTFYGFSISGCFSTMGGCTPPLNWPPIIAGAVIMGVAVLGLVWASWPRNGATSSEIPNPSTAS